MGETRRSGAPAGRRAAEVARDLRRRAAEAPDPATAAAHRGEIVALLSPVVAGGAPPPVGMLLAETLLDSGDAGTGLRVLEAVPGPLGASVPALTLRARALFGMGRMREGLAAAREALRREPGNALAAMQLRAFARWDGREEEPAEAAEGGVAVAVGSGLGNLIHATPLIRRLSAWLGERVEVIVAEDHPGAAPILHHPDHVSAVRPLGPSVLRRRYRLVFAVHAFGITRVPFAAERVAWARDWIAFRPGRGMHEAQFNLESARQVLGMPYAPSDAHHPFVHVAAPAPREPGLIGLHAGSKDGIWASKRWPHFAALTAALRARGHAVASFGLPSEHVPGTEDRTGGTIPEMASAMAACDAFVANDSGVMNVANALGLPLLALFGPTDWRTRGPLGERSRSLVLMKPCAPCELVEPGLFRTGTCTCIAELPVGAVLDALEATLRGEAAGPRRDGVPLRAAS